MKITRKDYMANSRELHHYYHAQFVTQETKDYILKSLSPEQIKISLDSGDEHLNTIKIPFNNMSRGGGWWWDFAPINVSLWRKLDNKQSNILPSKSMRTCVAKVAARMIAEDLNR